MTARIHFLRWGVCFVLVLSAATTAYGAVKAQHPEVNEVTVTSADLPAPFAGLRIAVISDIHVGPGISGAFVERLVDQVNAAQPDFIVIPGDLVDGPVSQLGPELAALGRLEAPYGVVLTTGNHEFYSGDVTQWIDYWRDLGITVLDNSGIQLTRQGTTIDVLGINDDQGSGRYEPDLEAAAETLHQAFGAPVDGRGRFRLLIAHEPAQALAGQDPADYGVDVQLAGHTHGGQMWPFDYAILTRQPVLEGVEQVGRITVVTSRGVGAWGPPVRVLADPEILIVTLER
jgi:predicted MPP superfamily phosphohydrolase